MREVKTAKKRSKLEKCFQTIVGIDDMEICNRIYPEYVSGIEKYLGNFGTFIHLFF